MVDYFDYPSTFAAPPEIYDMLCSGRTVMAVMAALAGQIASVGSSPWSDQSTPSYERSPC
eukprot:scaffold34890_cov54-Cyclotella_meneghiniana.AAC.4